MPTRSLRRAVGAAAIAVVLAVVLAVFLLIVRASPALWLDEAQSVAFARLPFAEIPHALRQDGAPPLYYLLLHAWTGVFGDGDVAVRALSAVFAVGFVAVLMVVVDRLAGRRAAVAAGVLGATNPFVVRYATETRMYTLVMLEVALATWALLTLWRRTAEDDHPPDWMSKQAASGRSAHPVRWVGRAWPPAVGLALATAALLYTHYWSLYLLSASLAVLALLAVRHPEARWAIAAIAVGALLWLPWFPSFLFQSGHTGTPWQRAPEFGEAFRALFLPRGHDWLAIILAVGLVLLALAAIAVKPALRPLAIVFVVGAALAFLGASISSSAFVPRYTAMLAPLLLALAACGVAVVRRAPLRVAIVALLATVGTVSTVRAIDEPRTRAAQVAAAITESATDGDVVVFCPDQLGPAVTRLLDRSSSPRLQLVSFPDVSHPGRVDWIDYAVRYRRADAQLGAAAFSAMAAHGTVWLVWSDVYPPTERACVSLRAALAQLRPIHWQVISEDLFDSDHDALWRYEPTSCGSSSTS